MTTFAEHADLDGRLLWWSCEVSFDDFDTISYRWATMSADVSPDPGDPAVSFEERIVGISNIQKAFGNDHLPAASNVTLVLDNTDFAMDFLVNRTTVASQVLRARFRLRCGLADPNDPTIKTQKVGTFVCLDLPRRQNGRIQLALADDSLGKLNDFLVPPSFREWFEDAGTDTDNSPFSNVSFDPRLLVDWNLPAPLHFGLGPWMGCEPSATFPVSRTPADFKTGDGFASGHRNFIFPILVCATRDTATAVTTDDVRELEGVFRPDVLTDNIYHYAESGPQRIPRTWAMTGDGGVYATQTIWRAYKTHTITKDGFEWQLLWVALDVLQYIRYMSQGRIVPPGGSIPPIVDIPTSPEFPPAQYIPPGVTPAAGVVDTYFAAFESFNVRGEFGSQVNGKSDTNTIGNAVDIMQDLVEYYSAHGAVDATRFARADLVTNIRVGGSIRPGLDKVTPQFQNSTRASPYGIGTLRKAIAELAATADLDVFLNRDAEVAVVAQGADFETQTTTYPSIDEERTGNVEDFIPSQGERWEPYNRVFIASRMGLVGPFDNAEAIDEWGQIRPRVLQSKWWWAMNTYGPDNLGTVDSDVWGLRNLESVIRPAISFVTDVFALTLELGDYFTMSWSRGGQNSAYSAALWKVEAMNIIPNTGAVEVTAVWMGDLQSAQPFLLDNETLIIRTTPAGGQTLTVTTGSLVATRSAGSFVTDGVVAGDIVRLRDTSEGALGFARNRDVRVASRDSATQLTLTSADDNFGTAGAHVIASSDWSVVRGATTYHTAVSDPANYPSGGAMYGKISNSVGQFSDASAANKLLDG